MIQLWSGSFLRSTIPDIWRFLWNQLRRFFGLNKCTTVKRFSAIFRHKTRIFSLQKVQEIQFWIKWLHNIYLTKAVYWKYSKIKIVQNFGHVQKKYNLQTWPIQFSYQNFNISIIGKIARKTKLKILKNAKN